MTSISSAAMAIAVVTLIGGFAVAGVADVRRREVADGLWQATGAVGLVTGAIVVAPGGLVPVLLWLLVAGLALEHLVGWDLWLGSRWDPHADQIELAAYVVSVAVVAAASVRYGVGPTGVPYAVIAVLAVVLFARALFELQVLYGAADAKALMIAGVLVPVLATPLLYAPAAAAPALAIIPFAVSMLTNTALFSVGVPIALALRNLRRGEFSVPEGFLGYSLPVRELPHRYVWVKDPAVATAPDDAETTEDDDRLRADIARELEGKGIERVWVTPQVPLVAVMALGAIAAVLAGNVLLDIMLRL